MPDSLPSQSKRGDVMEGYRTFSIGVCPICGDASTQFAECAGTPSEPHALTDTERVELVRADVHRGAVEALEWYADPANWDHIGPHGTVQGTGWRVVEDGGQRARRALGGR